MVNCPRCLEEKDHVSRVWYALMAMSLLAELKAVRDHKHHHTFSHYTRHHFHTRSTPGKIAFVASWTALWAWYTRHILKEVN